MKIHLILTSLTEISITLNEHKLRFHKSAVFIVKQTRMLSKVFQLIINDFEMSTENSFNIKKIFISNKN